ncbi:MAG TPA: transcription elongation factor GreA [Nitrospirae bacterium]|nr:transcription elongation factor GreA [bacterium BMS3Abin06]HDH11897.1 transcription elongation factor GreA [Nitrospirota bacterium]HDZ02761.1 transcription elongation factor GreA [Nitrospirota bacterium]
MNKMPITPQGYQKLKEELDKLLKVERPQNIKAIAEARAHGDLSENAEYHAAKERQSFIAGRIQELQSRLAQSQVIDPASISQDKIAFGATVKLLDVDSDEEKKYMLVGPDESDIKQGRISIQSPIARSLIGKEEGDVVIVQAPAKTIEYEILEIRFE